MKKNYIFLLFAIMLYLTAGSAIQENEGLKLWYDKPASKWEEALPVGNGRLGAMIYGGTS